MIERAHAWETGRLLTLPAPMTEFVILRGGLVLPWPAVALALDLERRGFNMRLDEQQDVMAKPTLAITEADRASIARRRRRTIRMTCPALSTRASTSIIEGPSSGRA
jgi:hypothetical protein